MRLVDADLLIENIRKLPNAGIRWFVSAEDVFDTILNAPTIAPERKKGRWIKNKYGFIVCSECDYPALEVMTGCLVNRHLEQYETDFCPNCGSYNGGRWK